MKKRSKRSSYLFALIAVVLFSGCLRAGSGGSRISRALETFYVEGGLTQYFIKPVYLSGKETNIWMDFTYRHDPKKNNQVICNFSLKSSKVEHQVTNAHFVVGQEKIQLKNLKKLVYSKSKKKYNFRYTSYITYATLKKMIQQPTFQFTVDTKNNQHFVYTASNKTKRKFRTINEKMIEVISLDQN